MSFIPKRPSGGPDPEETRGLQALWDWNWNPSFSLFVDKEGAPVRFSKRPDGRYDVLENLPKAGAVTVLLHPFKILRSPPNPDDDPEDPANWRTFRVRAGAYGTTPVDFTDGANESPDNPSSPVTHRVYHVDVDFIVPDATAAYYVWMDATNPDEPFIDHGTVIPGGGTDAEWWAGTYFLLGIIDTNTYTATQRAVWRQYVRDDIPKCA